ncbi:non-specific lipid-transfer protein 1-like [Chenopodium quinoa]|uniref:non-specific lipid-transfer protein 1-like n=1 Tax=Chenopodium quinoa TaxID=63459 RepID=UPI000B775331|nr:non-specific lipid-transfer protein 1-like [Chenopodium quinoa]
MMASSTVLTKKAVCLIFITMMVVAPHAVQAFSCGQVVTMLMPCLNYLKKGGSIPANCCGGVKDLANLAKTRPDRQAACKCIKPAAKSYGINYDLANKLPKACGVNYKINISPDIDCNKVTF